MGDDPHNATVWVARAESDRGGEVRFAPAGMVEPRSRAAQIF
jgi:hypothetical protein